MWSDSVIGLGSVFWAAVGSLRGIENMGASKKVSNPNFNLDWVLCLGKKDSYVRRGITVFLILNLDNQRASGRLIFRT